MLPKDRSHILLPSNLFRESHHPLPHSFIPQSPTMSASPWTDDITLDPAADPAGDPVDDPATDLSSPIAQQSSRYSVRFTGDGAPKQCQVNGPSPPTTDDPYIIQHSLYATHLPQADSPHQCNITDARPQSSPSSSSLSTSVAEALAAEPTLKANLPKPPPCCLCTMFSNFYWRPVDAITLTLSCILRWFLIWIMRPV